MSFLSVTNISLKDHSGKATLSEINFTQRRGEKVVIAGETGSGKSSLLKVIAGLIQPDNGDVLFEGNKVIGPREKLVPGHPSIAYLSQHFELPKSLRVEQILSYANSIAEDEAELVFDICRISDLKQRRSDQLSGGERQRIAIARLLIAAPSLLLLDEPFSHLDINHKAVLKSVIREIAEKLKISLILVSHEPSDTLPWADKIIVLRQGEMVQKGTGEKIYRSPVDEYVAGLFGKFNLFDIQDATFLQRFIKPGKKKWALIRPEDIYVGNKKQGFPATVVSNSFYGGFLEVEADVDGTRICFNVRDEAPSEGTTVYLAVNADRISFF